MDSGGQAGRGSAGGAEVELTGDGVEGDGAEHGQQAVAQEPGFAGEDGVGMEPGGDGFPTAVSEAEGCEGLGDAGAAGEAGGGGAGEVGAVGCGGDPMEGAGAAGVDAEALDRAVVDTGLDSETAGSGAEGDDRHGGGGVGRGGVDAQRTAFVVEFDDAIAEEVGADEAVHGVAAGLGQAMEVEDEQVIREADGADGGGASDGAVAERGIADPGDLDLGVKGEVQVPGRLAVEHADAGS